MKLIKMASGRRSVKISQNEWEAIGKTTGWDKSNKIIKEASWKVVDNEFNRANYSDLIGQTFDTPPSYAKVEEVPSISGTSNPSGTDFFANSDSKIGEIVRVLKEESGKDPTTKDSYALGALQAMFNGFIQEVKRATEGQTLSLSVSDRLGVSDLLKKIEEKFN